MKFLKLWYDCWGVIHSEWYSGRGDGINIVGPIAPDTVFLKVIKGEFDMLVVHYHDQGHIPLKLLAFDSGVNITVGLDVDAELEDKQFLDGRDSYGIMVNIKRWTAWNNWRTAALYGCSNFPFIELTIALAPIFAAIAYASMNKNKKATKL